MDDKLLFYYTIYGKPVMDDIIHAYNSNFRYYHNWDHAFTVAEICKKYSNNKELIFAALCHDIVYIPGAQNNINEDASAEFACYFIRKHKLDLNSEIVSDLIKATYISNHLRDTNIPSDKLEALLLDADLASLSLDFQTCIDNQAKIILEQANEYNTKHLEKSSIFLTNLLNARPNLYHTKSFQALSQRSAEANIRKLAKLFDKNF